MTSRLPAPLRTVLFHALRAAFRLTPMPVATRDRLRQRFLDRHADLVPQGPRGRIGAGRAPWRSAVRADERAIGHVPYLHETLPDPLPATLVAFYLPQFHAIPENDAWWGTGFTEWRNVTRALPQFEGHAQPKLPAELGYYDLRNPEVMRAQARLAREYGIGAFCFYFYWFGGKTLLETPLRQWLADTSIDLPFCLCWANEKWSRTWDGRGDEILIDQQHSPQDDLAFIAHVADYLRDPRYLRVDGKPMLLIYRPGLFPDMRATAARWRAWCREQGVGEIHLAYVQSFDQVDPADIGFDAAVEFPPNLSNAPNLTERQTLLNAEYGGQALDWRAMADHFRTRTLPAYSLYRGVNCGWDNEARRSGRGRSFLHASPRAYGEWLHEAIATSRVESGVPRPVFINAWNEWAEGATLEPDTRLGHAWLEATRRALVPRATASAQVQWAIVHVWYLELLEEILQQLGDDIAWALYVTVPAELEAQAREQLTRSQRPFRLQVVENRGRDILPFLHAADALSREGVDVVLKLHTKRSPHRRDGDVWRRQLLEELLDPALRQATLAAFQQDDHLGIAGPAAHLQPMSYYWGANEALIRALCVRLGIPDVHDGEGEFFSGSMFWLRLAALRPLLDAHLLPGEFDTEAGQVDGTLAHAVERLFCTIAQAEGFRVDTTAHLAGRTAPRGGDYAFAQRSH